MCEIIAPLPNLTDVDTVGNFSDDLKWGLTKKIIGPPCRIFLEGDKIVGVSFGQEEDLDTPDETNPYYSKLVQKGGVIDFSKDTFKICLMQKDKNG